ncbi:MAG: GHKL domain-containing protein [Bacteroidetes bacterium]|nr:GHKL domain-containing protein [Bacteroidota bacterium]
MIKKNILVKVILFLSIVAYNSKLIAQVNYNDETQNLSIGKDVYILVDPKGKLGINEIVKSDKFEKSKKDVPNMGITSSTVWLKIIIKNTSNLDNLILQLNQPIIDEVVFYDFKANTNKFEVLKMGEYQFFHLRKYLTPEYLFDIEIPKGTEKTFYLELKCKENMQIPLFVGTTKSAFKLVSNRNIGSGIYIGIMMVMLLYNLFIFGIVRDKSYLWYSIYIVLILLTQTSLQGLPFQFLWPNTPWLAIYSPYIFPSLVGIAGLEFFKEFLQMRVRNYKVFLYSYLFIIPYTVSIILSFTGKYGLSFQVMEVTASAVSVFMMVFAFKVYRQGNHEARFFLVGWSLFLVGICIYVLKDFEVLPYNNFTRYTMHFGSGAEVILLSFALADRINILKKEKEKSQVEALHALEENRKLITEQNIILEQKVHERTEELAQSNSELEVTLKNLKETQSQLVSVEKMASLGQLTAGIAHEINNPINFVSANIRPLNMDIKDVLELIDKYSSISPDDGNLSEKINEIEKFKKEIDLDYIKTEIDTLMNGIEDGAKRTAEIVKGLKNFSHLDESDIKEADINKGIESTLVILRSSTPPNIEVETNLAELPLVECYPGKLNQVFMNIFNNAIQAMDKYKEREKHKLTINSYLKNEHVYIECIDTGMGMTQEVKDKIFEPFFTTKDVGEGTGLGMSIVFGIIESHGAKIEIESEPGQGTKITLILNLKLQNKPIETV